MPTTGGRGSCSLSSFLLRLHLLGLRCVGAAALAETLALALPLRSGADSALLQRSSAEPPTPSPPAAAIRSKPLIGMRASRDSVIGLPAASRREGTAEA